MSKPVRRQISRIALMVAAPILLSWPVLDALVDAAPIRGDVPAGPPPVVVDAPASAPFRHVRSIGLPPHIGSPIDVAIAPDGALYIADANRIRAVDAVDASGTHHWRAARPASIPEGPTAVFPIALEQDPSRGTLDIVWQEYGRASGESDPGYGRAWIERRSADGETVLDPTLLPGEGRVSDLAAHVPTGDHYLARGGSVVRLVGGWTDVSATLPITYPGDGAARIALSDARLVLVSDGSARLHRLDGTPIGELDLEGHTGTAIGRTPDGGFGVLVTADRALITGTLSAVLAYDAAGARAPDGDLTVGDVEVQPPPSIEWPWAIAFAGAHAVFSTATRDGLFAARRLGPAELTLTSQSAPDPARAFPPYSPPSTPLYSRWTGGRSGGVAVAPGQDGGILVAGCQASEAGDVSHGGCAARSAVLFRLSTDEGFRGGRILGPGLSDIAAGKDGALFASYAGARFVYSGGTAKLHPRVERLGQDWDDPVWEASCDCEYSARIARAGDTVFAVEPLTGDAVGRDVGTGAIVRRIAGSGTAVGTWPADLASDGVGRLFAASTGRRVIERWSAGGTPDRSWSAGAGIGFGPRRIAHGAWHGTPVIAALASDGRLELHDADSGALILSWHPERPDGTPIGALDLAFDRVGRLYLIDGASGNIDVFAPVDGPWEPPTPTPGPSPTPPPSACSVSGDKVAGPRRVALGDTATITLTLRADCPPRDDSVGADIVLAIQVDRDDRAVGAHDVMGFVELWLGLVDTTLHRVGATTVRSTDVPVVIPLGTTPRVLLQRLGEIGPFWSSMRPSLPSNLAHDLLVATKRPSALPIIVYVDAMLEYMTTSEQELLRIVGERARVSGMLTYAIGLRGDRPWLRAFAGADERTFVQPAAHETAAILAHIMREAGSSLSGNLIIDDTMSDDVAYEIGSSIPRPIVASGASDLRWSRAVLPSTGMTMTFRVAPLHIGTIPTNRVAVARYDDVDGTRREFVYPIPEIEVFEPSPTPTRVPAPIYLPLAVKAACVRESTPLDVALSIDVSSSMAGAKLEAAKAAAKVFVGALDLAGGRDRAAVIAFDETAFVAAPLGSDGAALGRAIDGLSAGLGTRLDRALDASATALGAEADRRAGVAAAILLLTDGAHGGPEADVLLAAETARGVTGAAIWTIGLGAEADAELLSAVADPGAYRFAPDAAALTAVYDALTEEVGCR